jgi:polysaccharide biosynthesis protein PslG
MLRRLPIPSAGLILLVALCGLGLPAPSAVAAVTAPPSPSAVLGGVNIDGLGYGSRVGEADQQIANARRLHARVVRVEVPWAVLEPRAPGQLDAQALAFTDRLFADAAAAGIKVITTARSSPCWASSAPSSVLRGCSSTRLTPANAWPPSDPATYASFVAFLAQRYGNGLAAIEIWNEPDQANELYFAGPNKAQRYAAVLRAAYPAIKQANPSVTVIAGSLVGSNGVFLRALYAAGIKGYYDGLAVHFYNLTLGSLRSIRQVQLANGDTKPLWLDEFGWSSCWPRERLQEEQACVTTQVQAANIADTFRSLAHTSWVAAAVVFQLRDFPQENFGLLSSGGAPKPAFRALAGVLAAPARQPSPVRLALRRTNGRVLASGSAPVGDFMQLEVFKAGILRYRALFVLDRSNRYSIPLPRVLGASGLVVRTFQYWGGIGRAAQKSI